MTILRLNLHGTNTSKNLDGCWQQIVGGTTLAYDHAAIPGKNVSVPTARTAFVRARTLVMSGGASLPFMYETARALGQAIPQAQLHTLQGQRHAVSTEVLAPVLAEFFAR
jgi:pimeloyl-ACP methyl ester carboxylesterase